ncbi:MAG: nucleotidyltransferase domain-containing protein [Desulfamplus sp.]|nr:nucleotidyltransferase domain-containing protein [Desulfamplus sp.]
MNIETVKQQIVERLTPLEPEIIILFGSYAWGTPNDDSDLDIYVVTKDNFIPKNYNEKKSIILKVSKAIRDLQKHIPIDIITHTKKMHEQFVEMNSLFSQTIMQKGIRLKGNHNHE